MISSAVPVQTFASWASSRKAAVGWNISWLPAVTLLVTDIVAWPAIYLLFSQVRDMIYPAPGQFSWQVLLVPALISVMIIHLLGGYDRRTPMLSLGYTVEHLFGMVIALVVSAFVLYGVIIFGDLVKPSRLILVVNFIAFGTSTIVFRRWLTSSLTVHYSRRNFLLIADAETAASFQQIYRGRKMPQELRVYTVNATGQSLTDGTGLIGLDHALGALDQESDGVIIGIPPSTLDPKLTQALAYVHFRHIPVYTLESFHETQWRQVPVQSIEGWWAFARESALARNSIYDHAKRIFDAVLASVALVILSPVLLITAAAIRTESAGPAIFRQTRIGRDGRPFTLLKFRSMRIGSDKGPIYTSKKDSRITRLGHLLRRTRIDELLQLWNVVCGDMSIIGPRAEWIKCVERYDGKIPFYNYRHLVRPGITGWAQVNYPYGENDQDALEKLKFDLYYIRNYSLSLDVAIVLKTVQTMLFAKGR